MQNCIILFCFTLLVQFSIQASTQQSSTYIAAVVEFDPKLFETYDKDKVDRHAKQYVELIETESTEPTRDFDIIVFPESTLNKPHLAIEIPDQNDKIVPCGNDKYEKYFQEISCAAKRSKRYVVINLTTKKDCKKEQNANDQRPCSSDGWNLYNTNVVFDRNGAIISTYRKFNLFETNVNTTLTPDFGTFTTDFGVTFGMVICFDLLFKSPVLQLINEKGIKNIVYPTMWYSELPFLTAVQYQQNWAYRLNVNLLAAGGSNPSVGSTGSGIYSGKSGLTNAIMSPIAQTKLLISEIPKTPSTVTRVISTTETSSSNSVNSGTSVALIDLSKSKANQKKYSPFHNEVLSVQVTQDDVKKFKILPVSHGDGFGWVRFDLCDNGLCCLFFVEYWTLNYTPDVIAGTQQYSYVAAVTNSRRSFSGFADGGIQMCAIIACTNATDYSTCGSQYPVGTKILNQFTFSAINIKGSLNADNINTMPTSVTMGLLPLQSSEFNFTVGVAYDSNRGKYQDFTMALKTRKNNLLSFGIFARDFAKDNSATGLKF